MILGVLLILMAWCIPQVPMWLSIIMTVDGGLVFIASMINMALAIGKLASLSE